MTRAIVDRNRVAKAGLACVLLAALGPGAANGQPPAALATGLKEPTAVAVGTDGKVYVAAAGDGGGAVLVVRDGKAVPFAKGPDAPRALAAYLEWLFVADQ